MLNITREQKGSTLVLQLSGDINEQVDFAKAFGELAPDTVIQTKDISRINSLGVKAWIHYFQGRVAKGAHLRFVECSPPVVEQFNLIRNFACGGTIESIYVPFVCTTCKKSLLGLFKVDQLKATNFALPPVKCTKCGAAAVFDDVPEEYFAFAKRTGSSPRDQGPCAGSWPGNAPPDRYVSKALRNGHSESGS